MRHCQSPRGSPGIRIIRACVPPGCCLLQGVAIKEAAMSAHHHFDLVSHWRLEAPVERVWAALTDVEAWPQWWPYVRQVRMLRQGDGDGRGSVRRIEWKTRLPYDIAVEIEAIDVLRPERLRGRSRGHLQGEGIWLLRSENRV